MKVINKDIGGDLDSLYQLVAGRVGASGRDLEVVTYDGEGLSDVEWTDDAVVISLHSGIPTHALPHVLGVALQHVRQALDGYPLITSPDEPQPEGSELVRSSLRELVLESDAEGQLVSLGLDRTWENEQRHQAMKSLLKSPPAEWNDEDSLGNLFIALQYARMSLNHPPEMWQALQKRTEEVLPVAAQRGELALLAVKKRRWGNPRNALDSFMLVRDELGIEDLVQIQDPSGAVY
jgi:hypothetical protein